MAYIPNNTLLYNAALSGFLCGVTEGRALPSNAATLTASAQAFAQETDSLIPNDPAISELSGVALLPTLEPIQTAQISKVTLLQTLVSGAFSGRYTEDSTPSDYVGVATNVAVSYATASAALAL